MTALRLASGSCWHALAVVALLSSCAVNPVPTPGDQAPTQSTSDAGRWTDGSGKANNPDDGDDAGTEPGGGNCQVRDAAAVAVQNVGGKRPAKVFLPKGWDGCKKFPLVILLHGYSASGTVQDIYLGISAGRDKHGFVEILPEGTMAPNGKQFWNATNACCDFFGQKPDDVTYISGLVKEGIAKLAVDPERVYIIGHSNGGFMAYRMACEAPDLITGVASLAGAVTNTATDCKPKNPVHVLQMHGTDDKTIKFNGAALYPSAQVAIDRWRGLNACTDKTATGGPFDYEPVGKGKETTTKSWTECQRGTSVSLWTMQGSPHIPGVNASFKEALLSHVLAWRRDPAKK